MARPRTFDEHAAIERAMHAFWADGYECTSTEQLCTATGLGRSSIYNTFGSKHALFRKSLERYLDTMTQARIDSLRRPGSPRAKLTELLAGTITDECEGPERGCLAINTIAELGGRDPEINTMLARDAERYIAAIHEVVLAGQHDGEIDRARDARALALFLHSQIGALRLTARNGADRPTLEAIAAVALSTL